MASSRAENSIIVHDSLVVLFMFPSFNSAQLKINLNYVREEISPSGICTQPEDGVTR